MRKSVHFKLKKMDQSEEQKYKVSKQSVVPKVYVFFDTICDFFSPLACHHTTLL